MAEKVLVTGGTGYVAGWLIVELLRRGYDVRTTVRTLEKADAVRSAVTTEINPPKRPTSAAPVATEVASGVRPSSAAAVATEVDSGVRPALMAAVATEVDSGERPAFTAPVAAETDLGERLTFTAAVAAEIDPGERPAFAAAVATRIGLGTRLTFVAADLTSDNGWAEAVAGVDYVLHVASPLGDATTKDPQALIVPARDGTLRVLRAATAAGVKRVVMTSAANAASPSSYAEEGVTDETLWTDPDDPTLIPYRRSKTVAEKAAWDFMAGHDGPTTLTTILPGAVFGPILSTANLGSVEIVRRLLTGAMPGTPRIGLEIVDVRDLADLHIRAMTSPDAAGQRFLGTGEFTWMSEMAQALREGLGDAARKVPTRRLPNLLVRATALFDPSLRAITVSLGRRNRHSTAKANRLLDWHPRPAAETVVGCARSLIAWRVVPQC